jgi:hypothetical protein
MQVLAKAIRTFILLLLLNNAILLAQKTRNTESREEWRGPITVVAEDDFPSGATRTLELWQQLRSGN